MRDFTIAPIPLHIKFSLQIDNPNILLHDISLNTNLYIYIKLKRSIYYCYAPIKTYSPLIFHLFFSHFKLFSQFFKKKKKKKVFFSLSVHTYYYISSNFSPPFLPLYLSTTLCFTIRVLSSFYLSYILTLFLPILFCLNLISFLPFNPYFSHTKM